MSCYVEITWLDAELDCQSAYTADDFSSCTVDVGMKNVVDIAAMQMDIILPESRPDVLLDDANVVFGKRLDAHSHALNKVSERQYRLLVYSMDNMPIPGSEGTIVSLPLYSSEGADLRGQQVELRNIVLSDVKGANHEAPDVCYQLTQMHRVTFTADGDTVYSAIMEDGSEIVTPEAPAKEGYTFAGWNPEVDATVPAHDVTYDALFTVNQYTLTYFVDGESYSVQTLDYGTAITPLAEPIREGYTFSGWSDIPETMPAHDVDVTGSFAVNQYRVTFTLDGDTVYSELQDYGSEIVAPEAPAKEGYTFVGWNPEVDATVPAHDVEYVAQYQVNHYWVRYYVFDELVYEEEVAYGATFTLYEYTPAEGYIFNGWIGELYETMPAHDVEYHADMISGINNVTLVQEGHYYDLSGRKHAAPVRNGITIQRRADGRYVKVAHKQR